MQYLLIGGKADGRRMDINPTWSTITIRTIKPAQFTGDAVPWREVPMSDIARSEVHHDIYRREMISFGPASFVEFFIHRDLTPREAIERLLAHYVPSL